MNHDDKLARPADPNFDKMKWRCIGPARGGRVSAVAGDPVEPMTFYFGACGGGVWKTTDGGIYWECVSDGYFSSAAIGALAVAPSDRNVIYVGTGETNIRLDVSYGDGIYKSTDAGRSWRHIGLEETKFIGEIRVHPDNPDHLYVAALGDIFGENEHRGVYRSTDGGASWEKILERDAKTGCVDISLDPNNPRIVFAAFWEAHRKFWTLSSGGPGSALFRSMDGGDTWQEVSQHRGFAEGMLGKIGVSVSPAKSGRVFALVEAELEKSGLYRSDDYGESWDQICPNRDLIHRPWYYTHVFADPGHAETVYVTNYQMWKSTDGGVSFSEITTPHGDNHDLWIDPNDPQRMIEGNDGGACVSFNGGANWTSIYNQPTAQFYRLDIDDRFPYQVYATQQDNTSIAVPSASEWGAIPLSECSYPGTGESGFITVNPDDNNIVYIGAVGSSPGGSGALQRYDYRTRQIQLVNVWPEEAKGYNPGDLKYRFAWTYPIVFSPHDSNVLYAGGNHVFRTKDEGASWEEISPDLSRNAPERLMVSGGPLTGDSAGAEAYASCACIAENPHRKGEIWATTDDGLVHVTRDDGGDWENVTPSEMPELAYVGSVEISSHDADTVYVSATCYKSADYEPYLFRSADAGKSWEKITGDYPAGEITRVLRADPVRKGLLFAGSETGVFYSLNDGKNWRRMGGGLPVVPVYDLKLKGSDLVVATHGRSFWILDDITPLREMPQTIKGPRLFTPRDSHRTKMAWSVGLFGMFGRSYGPAFGVGGGSYTVQNADGETERRHLDVGENPPQGAIVYFWLPKGNEAPVSLSFRDASGEEIIAFASDTEEAGKKKLKPKAGMNRFVWDMKHPPATSFDRKLITPKYPPFGSKREGHPLGGGAAPVAVPGAYEVVLTVGDVEQKAEFEILKDPRVSATQDDFVAQFELIQRICDKQSALRQTVNHARQLKRQLSALPEKLPSGDKETRAAATEIIEKLDAIDEALGNPKRETPRDVLRFKAGLDDSLDNVLSMAAIADAAPPKQAYEIADEIDAKVDAQIAAFDKLVAGDLTALNGKIAEAGIAAVTVAPAEGGD